MDHCGLARRKTPLGQAPRRLAYGLRRLSKSARGDQVSAIDRANMMEEGIARLHHQARSLRAMRGPWWDPCHTAWGSRWCARGPEWLRRDRELSIPALTASNVTLSLALPIGAASNSRVPLEEDGTARVVRGSTRESDQPAPLGVPGQCWSARALQSVIPIESARAAFEIGDLQHTPSEPDGRLGR